MRKTIAVAELERCLQSVLDEVTRERTPYVVERDGQPEAALIPHVEYEAFLRFQQARALISERFDQMLDRLAEQNAHYSEQEAAADVEAAREEVAAMPARQRAEGSEVAR